jgi:protease I
MATYASIAGGKRVLMFVGDYVEDYEVMVPKQCLEALGHQVHSVSPDKAAGSFVKTAVHDFLDGEQTYTELRGHNFPVSHSFDDVNPEEYDALYIPGGRAPEFLRGNERVLEISQHFLDAQKPVAAVCHGLQVLSAIPNALTGKNLTAYPALAADLRNCGANFQEVHFHEAVVDGNLVTGAAWPAHQRVLSAFLHLLGTEVKTH